MSRLRTLVISLLIISALVGASGCTFTQTSSKTEIDYIQIRNHADHEVSYSVEITSDNSIIRRTVNASGSDPDRYDSTTKYIDLSNISAREFNISVRNSYESKTMTLSQDGTYYIVVRGNRYFEMAAFDRESDNQIVTTN